MLQIIPEKFKIELIISKEVVMFTADVLLFSGVDLITACDVRLCTQDAWFQVKVRTSVQ